jgi:hypothetical protein
MNYNPGERASRRYRLAVAQRPRRKGRFVKAPLDHIAAAALLDLSTGTSTSNSSNATSQVARRHLSARVINKRRSNTEGERGEAPNMARKNRDDGKRARTANRSGRQAQTAEKQKEEHPSMRPGVGHKKEWSPSDTDSSDDEDDRTFVPGYTNKKLPKCM